VLTERQHEKRSVSAVAPTVLARVSDSVRRTRVRGEDEFVTRTPVLTAVDASDIVPGAADAQGHATYWAVGAAGGVLRYVSAD